MVNDSSETKIIRDARSEGNQCIAMGLGVGGLSTITAMATGATCPLCFIAVPALIGMGVYRRITAGRVSSSNSPLNDNTKDPIGRS